jgi:multidrug efflux pump subunit AcrA (membrane-fusion protein)
MNALRLVMLIAAIAALASCGTKAADPSPAAPGAAQKGTPGGAPGQQGGRKFATIPVQAFDVTVGPLVADSNTAGSVVPVTQSAVASQVAGVVLRVAHRAGDWVKAGETVVQLDDSQLTLAARSAEASLQNARINFSVGRDNASSSNPKLTLQLQSAQSTLAGAQKNYESQKALYELGGISASQLDSARSQLEQAQANVEAARYALDTNQNSDTQATEQLRLAVDQASNQLEITRLNLRNAAIKAPFAGQIAAMNVNPGMYVSQNTSVFILVSADRQISFNVSPSDAPNLPLGSTVRFTYAGRTYPIRVSQAPSAPINGVVPMTAELPRGAELAYGAVGTVTYTLTLAQGALVPIASLNTLEDKNYVFTVVDGKAVQQTVTILDEAGIMAAVAGLSEGTKVIVNAPPGLLPGSAVQVVAAPGKDGAAQTGGGQAPQGEEPRKQGGKPGSQPSPGGKS